MHQFNSGESAIIIAIIIAYIAVTSWLTLRLRSRNSEQFMVGSRAMPAAVIGILLMSEFIGAKSTVGTSQEAFNYGMAAAWSVIGAAVGFLLYGLFFVRRLYASGAFTISGAIEQKFGRSTKITVSLIMIYALLLVNVGNYVSGAAALSTVLKVDLTMGMLIIAVVSTFYYVFGGLKGVAYVTILHSAVKVLGIALILGVALSMTGGITPMVEALPPEYFSLTGRIGVPTILAWVIGTIGAIFSTQFIMQAIAANKDEAAAQRSTFYAAALCFPLGIALGLVGVAAKFLNPTGNSLYALPMFLQAMNPWLAGLVTTSLVASVFVSVSTVALAIASLIVKDFYVPYARPTPQREFQMTRWISLAIGFAPLIFVFFVPEILKLSFFTRALRLSISIVAVMGFYLPFFRSSRGATLGLIASALATTAWYLLNNPYSIDNMYIAAITPALVLVVERLLQGGRAPAEAAPQGR
ncbi:sodium:solute symporter family protein [Roseomonas sp. GC11]|uniref:sodium:solute symporter family protein n=1 Tax=Roseomonas sp. GC11 TaxID=2950546 RepID=UPI002108B596|nr:sodium:solute symporter family protein [Roseomonas sp. GC11]MCQ4161635.1 sodium:solute symporter family protein [Roseomonas sp. GC11]